MMKRPIRVVSVVLLVAVVSGFASAETGEYVHANEFIALSFSVPQRQSFTTEHSNVERPGSPFGRSSLGSVLRNIGLIGIVAGAILMLAVKLYMKKARTTTLTVGGVGKVVPAQLFLMELAGLVLTWKGVRVADPTEEQTAASKHQAYTKLKNMTGEDFGWDVAGWFEFFTLHSDEYGFAHPQGYANMRSFLEECEHNLPWKEDVEITREPADAPDA